MKVLVIGSGGREHALLWKLSQSPSVTDVYVVPGNDGMSDVASLIPIKGNEDIIDFARLMQVDLTVAGPETVLTEGLADEFEKRGMGFFGPSKAAARIEGSKGFAKALMKKYGMPFRRIWLERRFLNAPQIIPALIYHGRLGRRRLAGGT